MHWVLSARGREREVRNKDDNTHKKNKQKEYLQLYKLILILKAHIFLDRDIVISQIKSIKYVL